MFTFGFPKSPCSWNVGSSPNCCFLCLLEANKRGRIEQELLEHQPWRRSKECRVNVDHLNRTKVMINPISCRFKWDGTWEWRQSSFLAAGLLLMSQPHPQKRCFPWGSSAWSWVWWERFGYGPLYFLFFLSLWCLFHKELDGLSQSCICLHTLLAF